MVALRGVTWRHSRGFTPLAAASQLYNDRHPDTTVTWDIRSLWSFGEEDLDGFARDYDLVVWDYPFTGAVAAGGCFAPLADLYDRDQIARFEQSFVGPAYAGFAAGGRQWALPIDAACQVAAARPDLLAAMGLELPKTWGDVVALARMGLVAMPLRPMGIWASLLSLCGAAGDVPFTSPEAPFQREAALLALNQLAELVPLLDRGCFEVFPTALFSTMSSRDSVAYVPLAYGYSPYAEPSYASRPLTFLAPVANGTTFRGATYGGAGISVSSTSAYRAEAAIFMAWLASDEVQCGVIKHCYGQPAAKAAWNVESGTGGFYRSTLPTMELAFSRPTVPAFHEFQSAAGKFLQDTFKAGAVDAKAVLDELTELYRRQLAPQLFG